MVSGCTAPGGPGSAASWSRDAGDSDGAAPDTVSVVTGACKPAESSERLPPRIDLMGAAPAGTKTGQVFEVSDLYDRVKTSCGMCHISTANGGKQVNEATFSSTFDETWLAAIESDDPRRAMPPENRGFSQRPEGDSIRKLAGLLETWMAQGRPADQFFVFDSNATVAGDGYRFTPAMGMAMTNLGNCVPSAELYAASSSQEMESKDQMFADADHLPTNLAGTDLTTFDSDILALNGVVAFVPAYPLWSDGSSKIRHIRVPKGTSVKFDKAKQSFEIPPNTRFYKTFLRRVTDGAGNPDRYRKMETRLIVARAPETAPDGTVTQKALFGTYIWSKDESTATLRDAPYRDGTPFADLTTSYVTDEIEYQAVVDSLPPGSGEPPQGDRLSERLRVALAKDHPGLLRHYAVPGRIRCEQCHQGSVTMDFVLGFNPLQIARRADMTGGTYEHTGADELNQLQRLIDYGVISGMTSAADVLPLEESQAPRKPRTPEELLAQGYMLGNCAHCHNPTGYPSIAKPALAKALNFMPHVDGGGIFELSLESMSPVRSRGANGDVRMPYITPSLRDYPVALATDLVRWDNGVNLSSSTSQDNNSKVEQTWSPKYSVELMETVPPAGCAAAASNLTKGYCGDRTTGLAFVPAPWRSLIYRNVDTPFPYFDDYVPFPHMPMNTAGFDCRAPRIMADWMVSLPAVLKNQKASEDKLPTVNTVKGDGSIIDDEQPYAEVKLGDPRYDAAVTAARRRLTEYHQGVRYGYCQDALGEDILDPIGSSFFVAVDPTFATQPGRTTYLPNSHRPTYGDGSPIPDPAHPDRYFPQLGVPYHGHWFDFDPTDPPPPWQPRRADVWKSALVDGQIDQTPPPGLTARTAAELSTKLSAILEDRRLAIAGIRQVELGPDLRNYATAPRPYGIWLSKPECDTKLAATRTVASFDGDAQRPGWFDVAKPVPDSRVFMMSPGGALYRHICFNCHGPKADGKGLQADALAASSEGHARPANFVTGLFGPVTSPGASLLEVFGMPQGDARTAALWAPRYMAWMALGGTLQLIPDDIINQVRAATILGERRPNLSRLPAPSGNMLDLARSLCNVVLPGKGIAGPRQVFEGLGTGRQYPPLYDEKTASFIRLNGDWEMWMSLCSRFNTPVLRVYRIRNDGTAENPSFVSYLEALYFADGFSAGAGVLDHNQELRAGIGVDNYYPACLHDSSERRLQNVLPDPLLPVGPEVVQAFQTRTRMPSCPTDFLADPARVMWHESPINLTPEQSKAEADNLAEWTLRGAANAGMAVFSYLEKQTADPAHAESTIYFNECQLLP